MHLYRGESASSCSSSCTTLLEKVAACGSDESCLCGHVTADGIQDCLACGSRWTLQKYQATCVVSSTSTIAGPSASVFPPEDPLAPSATLTAPFGSSSGSPGGYNFIAPGELEPSLDAASMNEHIYRSKAVFYTVLIIGVLVVAFCVYFFVILGRLIEFVFRKSQESSKKSKLRRRPAVLRYAFPPPYELGMSSIGTTVTNGYIPVNSMQNPASATSTPSCDTSAPHSPPHYAASILHAPIPRLPLFPPLRGLSASPPGYEIPNPTFLQYQPLNPPDIPETYKYQP
ncbi:hypothetical protein FRB99_005604 [Tulasnella sp. 403]|nr:hypothetical protein FRB99_005604 [Tulasnella sp. 403]